MSGIRRRRDILKMAQRFCAEATVSVTASNHIKVLLKGPVGERSVFTAASPSDSQRGDRNLKSNLRQAAIDLGCIPSRNPSAQVRR